MQMLEVRTLDILNDYHVKSVLGQGSEGTIYLVEDKDTLKKLVLKVFHEPRTSDWLPGLPVYADKISANDLGLPEVKVLYNRDEIIGVVYPYVQLRSLHWRILNSFEKVAQSIVGSYCNKQYYLMTHYSLALWDPVVSNFKVDKDGRWHFLDVGGGICLLDHPYVIKRGVIGYGFASMLMSIYNKALHELMMPVEGYSYDAPCIYCSNEWLDTIAMQHEWVREILSYVRSHNSSIFYDPEFYQRISEGLPSRVPSPSVILPLSQTLFGVRKLRGKSD
jgi:hypothetical protein